MKKALWLSLLACGLLASPAVGLQPPRGPAQEKFYRHPDLYVPELTETLASLAPNVATALAREANALGATPDSVFYDSRVGRWSSLILRHPLIPGHGDGNSLRWPNGLAPEGEAAFQAEVWSALRAYLESHKDVLRLDLSEISDVPRIASYRDGALVFVYAPRVVDGIPVRDNSIGAAVNGGNLILLGVQKWGDVDVSRTPSIEASAAETVVRSHAAPLPVQELVKVSHLELVPLSGPTGIHYRLAWVVTCRIEDDPGTWEGLVDAANGTLLAFEDTNQYADSRVVGGVYPVSNDHRPPDGNEQAGWPMPFVDFTVDAVKQYSDTGGNLGCIPGSISTALNGLYLKMVDTCGAINENATGTIDLGFGPGALLTDCAIPSGHSAGDTKASRSGYYELNRIAEQARGYLGAADPGGIWAREQLTANMNIPQACNANWNGAAVNFFRSSPPDGCRNTGEIAAIFDHEWGHGMDNNGVNPNIAGPGEAVADIYAALRLNTSCIGRGFFTDRVCDGYGDACDGTPTTGCTGVRDINYVNHRCDQPHTISWILGGFSSAQCGGTGSASACPAQGSTGPCNRETHCEGMVMAEASWDLMTRDLLDPPFNYDSQTAHEIATRLLYFGAQGVGNWYTCSVGGGCSATGGYLSVLAADDDDGNLGNGTPHMTAIRAAFERHEIHCTTPAVANSGCAASPVDAPTVTLAGQDRAIAVSWTAVADAASYVVYRGEGIDPCNFGKVIIAETSELSFLDQGLSNARPYSYAVMAVGANGACFGPQSACVSGQPAAGANFAFSGGTQLSGGDLDPFLDNCETATVSFSVTNIGTTDLTNVQILSVTAVTHPLTEFLTAFPAPIAATLTSCQTVAGSFQIVPQGLVFDGDSDFLVTIAADELGSDTRTKLIRLSHTESDLAPVTSQTFSFETDTEGWTTISGTFNRVTGSGGDGTNAHLSSSSGANNRCDVTRSPLIVLSDTSTLSMYVRYDIEPPSGGAQWDRANVSLVDANTGDRTVVRPSGGRQYTVPVGAANGTCGTGSQPGWNGMSPTYPTFLLSTWTPAALNPGGSFTGAAVALQVNYGTDESIAGQGFDFDEVKLTDFSIQVPDAHSDDCSLATQVGPTGLAVDGAGNGVLEVGEVAAVSPAWSNTGLNAVDLTASITDFTGPAGPTYTVTDGTAAYGTLVPGDSAACTDCYAVQITAAARPQPHWDALLTEVTAELAAPAAVFQKIWTLHVGESFTDVPSSNSFYSAIETVLHNGVTAGCGDGTTFCPADAVTRQQMAVFLLKAKEGAGYLPPACTTPVFTDVPCSSPFAPWINELAARAVTAGCGDGTTYCPTDPTNRQQMAVFLLKTDEGSSFTPPPCTVQVFDDVPCSSPFAPWIDELVARNVTAGCGGNNYCPANQVARQQMAVFLTKMFGLLLYGV